MNIIKNWFRKSLSDPQVVMMTVIIVGGLIVVWLFGDMLTPAIAAIVIAFLLDGPAQRLRERGLSNLLAASIVFIGFLFLVFVASVAILPPIAGQFVQFFTLLPNMFSTVQELLFALPERFPGLVDEAQIEQLMTSLRGDILDLGQQALQFSIGGLSSAVTIAVYFILVPVMVFFFLKDKTAILSYLSGFLPQHRPMAETVWKDAVERAGDYARGKVYEILIVGFSAWLAYSLIDLRFAAFLALLTGLSVVIPYIGAAAVTIPVAAVALLQWGVGQEFVIAVGVYLVLQALDGNVLAPLLFAEVVKLHPNAIILAILVFGGIWGFWGVFFAIPLATAAHAVIKAWPRTMEEDRES